MRRTSGFTLIEVMIVVAIVAILATVAYPSYRGFIQRAIRSQGQQYLMDLSQRQEQYFLDARSYSADPAQLQGLVPMPQKVTANYQLQVAACAAPCLTYTMTLTTIAGSAMYPTGAVSDGNLVINNLQQHWREVGADNTYDAAKDCLWEDSRCVPQ